MTRFFGTILFIAIGSTLNGQTLLSKADSLDIDYKFYVFTDSNTIHLTSLGSLERQFPRHKFKGLNYEKSSGLISIEGLIDVCCFEILVAKAIGNDKLSNIRRFGETQEITEILIDDRFTGKYIVKTKFEHDDVLIIGNPGTLYWGATIIPIGKIVAIK